ncbi:glycosyltransferase family 2 protein [Carboxylicivirga sp. N1Y90]|uniref:glycosyltransferase family 2 protein n=1 Tax=Carboxylicivirga fragile TaxID=3417571 RepID=UPI003D35327C|nr:glycosyltransferase [Marinilabiliaceae bacterium N1Y90]
MASTVSIITIVYNGRDTLEKTIKSICSQTYNNIEYIIVDGGSTDGTVELIKRYESSISKWISEPDKGLYDAMNKGIKMATGDYLWFINSGDEVFAPDTLSQLFDQNPTADIYYGDTVMIDSLGQLIGERRLQPPKQLSWTDFKNGMLVSHQSILIARNIASLYNTKYTFSADFEWCLVALKKAKTVVNTELVLSRFLDGGLTKQNIVPGLKERFRIMVNYFGLFSTLWHHIPISFRFVLYVIRNKRF